MSWQQALRMWGRDTMYGIGILGAYYGLQSSFSATWVDGGSMWPTINPNSTSEKRTFVFVHKWRHSFERGDIITAWSPDEKGKWVIKRVVGLEGDYVRNRLSGKVLRVPRGTLWVEGDNARISRDSNMYGPLPINLAVGVATRVLVPQEVRHNSKWKSEIFSPLKTRDVSARLASQIDFLDQEIAAMKEKNLMKDLLLKHRYAESRLEEDREDSGLFDSLTDATPFLNCDNESNAISGDVSGSGNISNNHKKGATSDIKDTAELEKRLAKTMEELPLDEAIKAKVLLEVKESIARSTKST